MGRVGTMRLHLLVAAGALAVLPASCGARSELLDGSGASAAQGGAGGQAGAGGEPVTGGEGGAAPCTDEVCNGADDDCDGSTDEGFGIGAPCDGPDSDFCLDDAMTCDGCSAGADALEVCNGVDDDCDGAVDSDCEVGNCTPDLVVVDLVKSMPSCFVDSVQVGSQGGIEYPCEGGPVSATFGPITFTGTVVDGAAALDATTTFDWSDGCTWSSSQTITGTLASGSLEYTYSEMPIQGTGCFEPCSAKGTIAVIW
jgi:hypothetical protein